MNQHGTKIHDVEIEIIDELVVSISNYLDTLSQRDCCIQMWDGKSMNFLFPKSCRTTAKCELNLIIFICMCGFGVKLIFGVMPSDFILKIAIMYLVFKSS